MNTKALLMCQQLRQDLLLHDHDDDQGRVSLPWLTMRIKNIESELIRDD